MASITNNLIKVIFYRKKRLVLETECLNISELTIITAVSKIDSGNRAAMGGDDFAPNFSQPFALVT
jgi:hypothetical protein